MTVQVAAALILGLAASIEDIAARRISNWIPAAGLVCGLGWHAAVSGWRGILTAVLGAGAGFAVFLLFYILGGMGGGDIKLMAGLGSLLGPGRLLEAALWTAAAGGLIALGYLGVQAVRRKVAGKPSVVKSVVQKESIPYAPAIAIGAWLSLVPKG